jgi:hypothetical protein
LWTVVICIVITLLASGFYLRYRNKLREGRDKERIKKIKVARDYLTSLTYNYMLLFLLKIQSDTKDLPDSVLKEELQQPVAFTSSMIQKGTVDIFSFVFIYHIIERWKTIASESFGEILNQMIQHVPIERWKEYSDILKEMLLEIDYIVEVYEPYLSTEVLVILADMRATSYSFARCASLLPSIYERLYSEKTVFEFFIQASTTCLHSTFQAISRLADTFQESIEQARDQHLRQLSV